MGEPQPAVFILGAPGRWKATPRRYPCDLCQLAHPIQPNTYKTIKELKKVPGQLVLILCYPCFKKKEQDYVHPGSMEAGIEAARKILGLDK